MKRFKVITQARNGKMDSREIEAMNEADARREAKTYGRVVKVTKGSIFSFEPPLELQHRQVIFHRMAAMLGSKVGTGNALNLMEEHFGSPIGTTCGKLKKQIDAGYTMDKAMENLGPKFFPKNVVALVQAGFRGGNSADALSTAADFEKEMHDVKKGSMFDIYLSIGLFFLAAIVTFGTTRYVAPMMAESSLMQMNKGSAPNPIYSILGTVSEISMGVIGTFLISLLLLGTVGRLFNPSFADGIIVKIPFYKDLILAKNNYATLYSLSLLIGAGVQIEQALELSAETSPKGKMRDDLTSALDRVRKGLPWAIAMTSLHPTDRAALGQSMDRAGIINALKSLSSQYRSLYASRLATLGPALKTLASLFIILAGTVLFGLTILPILQMSAQGF